MLSQMEAKRGNALRVTFTVPKEELPEGDFPREFVGWVVQEDDGTWIAHISEVCYEEHGSAESGPTGLSSSWVHFDTFPLDIRYLHPVEADGTPNREDLWEALDAGIGHSLAEEYTQKWANYTYDGY